jgi:hypothetical protein
MSDADKVVLEEALDSQDFTVPFQQKRWQEITDQNATNGAFNGQITFDLANLSSMNQWAHLAEGYVNFPVKFSIKNISGGTRTISSGAPGFAAMCAKGGWHSFVDSVSITIGSTNIQSPNIYNNIHTSFKMLTEWSQDELQKHGDTLGVAVDDYAFDKKEDGSVSNVGLDGVSTGFLFDRRGPRLTDPALNEAFNKRSIACNSLHKDPATAVGDILGSNGQSLGKNSSQSGSSAADQGDIYVCYALATVRLKDISSAIANLPPMKSVKGMLTINYNSAYCDYSLTQAATVATIASVTCSPIYGRTMPAMVRTDFVPILNADVDSSWRIQAEVSAVLSTNLTQATPPQTNARLYVPVYVASPEIDRALSMKKTIRYLERYQTTMTVEPNSSWSGAITAGIQNPRRLTLSQYFIADPQDVIGGGSTRILPSPLLSPFSHEGFGTSPFAAIKDWQVDVSGRPVFQSPMNQDFHTFLQEISECGLNGGLTHQMSSGLLSKRLWDQLYRFYTVDLSRRIEGEDGASVSVQTSFTNATQLKTNVVANLDHEKELTVDTQYGLISQGL